MLQTTRRDLIRSAAATWAAFSGVLRAADTNAESYWKLVKREFPLDERIIYLNAANVCPASRPVMDRHLEFLRDFHANPSFQNRDKYGSLRERLRGKLAALLGAANDEIAITRNTSEASNIVVQGLDLKPGDEVIITAHNHPSNNDSWKVRARREGFIVKSLPVPVPARNADELLGAFERAITPRTRVIAVTHVTNTTGVLYPVREIAALARPKGIFVHVDGAQTFGALDVNLRQMGCDSFSGSAHKWLMGPLEAGVLYIRAERIPQVWPSIVTAGWSDDVRGARKFEVFGQRDDPRIVAVEAAVDFINLIGMANVESRMRALAMRTKTALGNLPNVEMKTSQEPALSGGVIKFRLKDVPTKHAYDALWERSRLAIAMTGSGDAEGLRISPQVYNSFEEIDAAVAAVRRLSA
jgi:selenocysteine lyase/cysteine desulfurase